MRMLLASRLILTTALLTPSIGWGANQLFESHQRLFSDGTEAGSAGLLAEDDVTETLDSDNLDVTYLYRTQVKFAHCTGSQVIPESEGLTAQLQYRVDLGTWTAVNGSSSYVRSQATSNIADGANTTRRLTVGTGTFSGTAQFDEVNGATAAITLWRGDGEIQDDVYTEVLFSIQFRSAELTDTDTIQLRVTDNGVAFACGTSYPVTPTYTFSISTGAPANFFFGTLPFKNKARPGAYQALLALGGIRG